ncbi:MAG: hypothetical protein K6G48_04310 [Acholeplasmatales bacterium]|nr:hypothetical protein [Acholeplasmatales bacterium]
MAVNRNQSDYDRAVAIKGKLSKILNVIVSVVSIIVSIITAFLYAAGKVEMTTAGIIIPAALLIYLVMGVLTLVGSNEKRKSVMIIYIIGISICAVILFISVIYASVH